MPDRLTATEKESILFAIEALEMDVKRMEAECSTLRSALLIMYKRATEGE
jgi:hypothetical protein